MKTEKQSGQRLKAYNVQKLQVIYYAGQELKDFLDFKVSRYCEVYISGVFEDLKFKISEGYKQN